MAKYMDYYFYQAGVYSKEALAWARENGHELDGHLIRLDDGPNGFHYFADLVKRAGLDGIYLSHFFTRNTDLVNAINEAGIPLVLSERKLS